jgi:predicted secreted hydrolase
VASYGTYVAPDGSVRRLKSDEMKFRSAGIWTSPSTDTTYPSGWTVAALPVSMVVTLEPVQQTAEFTASTYIPVRYWEGAVSVQGTKDGVPVGGKGFVELVGYSSSRTGFGIPPPPQGR